MIPRHEKLSSTGALSGSGPRADPDWTPGPKRCSIVSEVSNTLVQTISITKMGGSDFSSDLERGAAPRSIADEFSDPPILVIEFTKV